MLSVLRLTSVLKKLQLADIAKYLLLRTSERISVAGTTTTTTTSQRFKSSPAAASHMIAPSGGISMSECCTASGVSCGTAKGSHPDSKDGNNSAKMASSGDTVQSSYSNSDQKSASKSDNTTKACFSTSLGDIVKFLELVGDLKHTKRTGWVLRDIKDVESISGHMYRMSMMTFLLDGTEGLDRTKCMELALVHDLAEALVGDITPFCGISREEKRLRELKAMDDICKLIEPRGKRIMELFVEYEASETPESKFVKDLDRLDMMLQAFEYEKRDDCVMKHQEFFDSTDGKFSHPFVVKLVNEINSQRLALAEKKGVANGHENPQQQQQNGNDNDLPQKTASTS